MKIVNEDPSDEKEVKTLQYFFDGHIWHQKWEQKLDASLLVMENNCNELEVIQQQIFDGQVSPLAYYIHKKSFTIHLLTSYTGISRRLIKKHLKPEFFNLLDEKTLLKYANAFEISVEELKTIEK